MGITEINQCLLPGRDDKIKTLQSINEMLDILLIA